MQKKKTYAVFGLGRYGIAVARELVENGMEVIAIDSNQKIVNDAAAFLPVCKCADVTDQEVITRLGRLDNSAFIDQLSIGSVVSPGKLCCNTIVSYVRAMKNRDGAAIAVHHVADGQAEAIEFLVDPDTFHCDEPLRKIKFKENVRVVCVARGNDIIIPGGDDCFKEGDCVVVVVNGENTILELNDIFA